MTSDINGAQGDTVKYSAYGEVRAGGTATDYLYTSQRNEVEIGLDYYVARFYDPVTGHFIQADTIVPEAGSSKAYDRYGYVNNNPVRYNDLSGHIACADWDKYGKCIPERSADLTITTKDQKFIGGIPVTTARDNSLIKELQIQGGIPNLANWLLFTLYMNSESVTARALSKAQNQLNMGGTNSYQAWIAMVDYGQPWDYKVDLVSQNVKRIVLGENTVGYQYLANIHYGYVGKASGFSSVELHGGAGYAAIKNEWENNGTLTNLTNYWYLLGDEPEDFRAVEIGIWLYENQKRTGDILSVDMLNEAFEVINLPGGMK